MQKLGCFSGCGELCNWPGTCKVNWEALQGIKTALTHPN